VFSQGNVVVNALIVGCSGSAISHAQQDNTLLNVTIVGTNSHSVDITGGARSIFKNLVAMNSNNSGLSMSIATNMSFLNAASGHHAVNGYRLVSATNNAAFAGSLL